MSSSYAREKLAMAVYTLATGTGTIQQRLLDAFLSMSALSARDFDGARLSEWESIYKRATATDGPDGAYSASLLGMSTDDAAQLARDLCELEAMIELDAS